MNIIFLVLIIFALIFLSRFLLILYGAIRELNNNKNINKQTDEFEGFISIIIPARNEEENIEAAVRSTFNANYDKSKYEIVAVNDRSTDKTGDILDKLKDEMPNLVVLHLTEESKGKDLVGKAGALQLGIEASKGVLILLTDADCEVNPDFVNFYAKTFANNDIKLALSYSLIKGKSLFDSIQAVEWYYLHTFAAAGIGFDYHLGGYGNNMAFLRDIYFEVGGYRKNKFSVTEDFVLIRAIKNAGAKIKYLTFNESSVLTLPMPDLKSYTEQHRRWALGGLAHHGWVAVAFIVSTLSVWFGLILSFIMGWYWLGLGFIGMRAVADAIIVLMPMIKMKEYKYLNTLPISLIFFQLFELVLPFTLFKRQIVWKGQVFKQ
jgi:cellulose synthase/poly-beta-1,6-N-acetylglucosamine synthase-like glycosyltransferase